MGLISISSFIYIYYNIDNKLKYLNHIYEYNMVKYDSELNDWCNRYFIIYVLLSNIIYTMVIVESTAAGLIISLITN